MRIALLLLSVLSLAGCTKVAFKPVEKADALKSSNVFGGTTNGGAISGGTPNVGGINLPGGLTSGHDSGQLLPPTGTLSGGNLSIPITRFCSDALSSSSGTNLNAASTVKMQLVSAASVAVCTRTDTAQIKTDLRSGTIKFNGCNPANGTYSINVVDQNNVNLLIGSNSITVSNGTVTLSGSIMVLVDTNPAESGEVAGLPAYSGVTCDMNASPLYVDFRKDRSQAMTLSSPEDGVMFDILGANGKPAYSKDKISWFNETVFALLALPNSKGQVNGIDELFGNNTIGRDGKFADNGFLALAKFDDNSDGVIDEQDEVFQHLRLWFDYNRDGVATSRELVLLTSKRVIAIDLDYDPNYYERDQHGNEIKYKSVVRFASGALRSIFDVWFKL